MKAYSVVPTIAHDQDIAQNQDRECFWIAVAEDGAPERRLPVRFSSRAEAEAAIVWLEQAPARPPFGRKK
jgi:hypothetical protein